MNDRRSWGIIAVLLVILTITVWRRTVYTRPQRTESTVTPTSGVSRVTTEPAVYYADTTGYYARPNDTATYPGIVLIHEWWGLNDAVKNSAETLAARGYQVLAVDLFGGIVATDAATARQLTAASDAETSVKNLQSAMLFLADRGAEKIGSWGWCFGGGQSMKLATSGVPLDASVIYYGALETDEAKLSTITWPVMGVFGSRDTSIPVSQVNSFDDSLTKLQIPHEIHIYPGVGHAFANPSNSGYAPKEAADAWEKTVSFLDRTLKSP